MFKRLSRFFKVYDDEINIFLWSVLLLFLIRCACIIFNNYAETTFLKRYGVEYLPIIYVINSVSTFLIMSLLVGVIKKQPGTRLLSFLLLIFGATVGGLRFIIQLDIDLLYPILLIFNTQFEMLLVLVFWNLGNDLFNARQSKRIFPLITIGGVIGRIIGSFGTPFLIKIVSLDNLMFVYCGFAVAGAIIAMRMFYLFPTLLMSSKKEKKAAAKTSQKEEFKKILGFVKESTLLKVFIFITILPNVVIPILNYQFNYAINEVFASEGGMIEFFSYFRGITNIISLIILLFVGRIYSRWGLPIVLLFHPMNYMLVFAVFLFRLDLFAAMYARLSTNIIRTTMNAPVVTILMGLFPAAQRNIVRPFLRGTVVRVGTLSGSAIILLTQNVIHPSYLSIIAMICVSGWLATIFFLKKGYSKILLQLISKSMIDLKTMEEQDIGHVFKDKAAQSHLEQQFKSARGVDVIWYAKQLKIQKFKNLDQSILSVLEHHDNLLKIELMKYLSPAAHEEVLAISREIADYQDEELMVALLKSINRFPPEVTRSFLETVYNDADSTVIKAYAVVGLYHGAPGTYRIIINEWIRSDNLIEKEAGIITVGESGDTSYIPVLEAELRHDQPDVIKTELLIGLFRLGAMGLNQKIIQFLSYTEASIRHAALNLYEIIEDEDMDRIILMLNDSVDQIRKAASDKLLNAPYQNPLRLIKALVLPGRKIREGVFELLENLNIKELDMFRYAQAEIETGYLDLIERQSIKNLPASSERDLLQDHLKEKMLSRLENVLRALSAQDPTGRMRIVCHGVFSQDARQRSNSLEALEEVLDTSLSKIMIPLLEIHSTSETIKIGRKKFNLPSIGNNHTAVYNHLLKKRDWVVVILTLAIAKKEDTKHLIGKQISQLAESENLQIQKMAISALTE
ncbi:MAG: cyclic nucleotide-binding protein [Deltaproteobacteria bacterium]|jgi:hypothetical protein|nr:cyclic nucleotide-binding protein [Deltaproteobacteria bacterium]MBT4088315.1 cyclic nucleotide-binding protein [Deltaproteobacteria bacterium]MBT4642829.1 cyclic nucleotide-binding protein [Deltaproteobacteria bacterium]MBT7713024.1 cyclic nucleotide-binding protein [Deltaproteobacteria bacterium]MBT7890693.1 cyclic nucleotide-binding protein [Deltaproteobacteria bacterium]